MNHKVYVFDMQNNEHGSLLKGSKWTSILKSALVYYECYV